MSNKLHLKFQRNKSSYHWTPYHLTTMNVGQPQCQFSRLLYPTDELSLDMTTFMRMQPLVAPAYVRGKEKLTATFVPLYQIDELADDYLAGNVTVGGYKAQGLFIDAHAIMDIFASQSVDFLLSSRNTTGSTANTHFHWYTNAQTANPMEPHTLSVLGKKVYKVLKNLGYDFISQDLGLNNQLRVWNAYPLLAYAKMLCDVYYPQQVKLDSRLYSNLTKIKFHDSSVVGVAIGNVGGQVILPVVIKQILMDIVEIHSMYQSDYFTTAWVTPNSPNGSPHNPVSYFYTNARGVDGDGHYQVVTGNTSYSNDNNQVAVSTYLTARAQDALIAFDKFIRRNNLVGQSASARLLSMFGVKVEQAKSHDTIILNTGANDLNISDVTSFANTESGSTGSQLGEYAGKGYLSGKFGVKFKAPDYGYFFITSAIIVDPCYAEGIDHEILNRVSSDYYTPEYDEMQAAPVALMELRSANMFKSTATIANDNFINGTFGYQSNYEWMRSHRDSISGDFLTNEDMRKSWTTSRNNSSDNLNAQNPQVLFYDNNAYNTLFQDTNLDYDKFLCSYNFDIHITRPIKSSSEATGLPQGDLTIDKLGNKNL